VILQVDSVRQFRIGDRAPSVIGATHNKRFYALDLQAGRAAVFISLGADAPDAAKRLFDQIRPVHEMLRAAGVDLVPLAPQASSYAAAFADDEDARELVVHVVEAGGLERAKHQDRPLAMAIDRSGRIVHLEPLDDPADMTALYRRIAPRLAAEPPRVMQSSAPVLILPNLISADTCAEIIAHFEASPHQAGLMASLDNDAPTIKFDESKKKRRDMELAPESPLHRDMLAVLAERCVPEIKRAFQSDITFADRILIARYDDTGGYFKRHRDNAAPQTAFREFAVSINLNTHEYEGGELLFPEYDDHRYSPPAGGAIVFSASLLHEAAPVTRGRRYVLLSFLCSAAAQGRIIQAA
jgi:predicted 2-oxoglutarate/Fe(II)-dependent dioxygenase YbiX